jgi:hypothetical protein
MEAIMKTTEQRTAIFENLTKVLFCMHRAYSLGFISRSGMNEICEFIYLEKEALKNGV